MTTGTHGYLKESLEEGLLLVSGGRASARESMKRKETSKRHVGTLKTQLQMLTQTSGLGVPAGDGGIQLKERQTVTVEIMVKK